MDRTRMVVKVCFNVISGQEVIKDGIDEQGGLVPGLLRVAETQTTFKNVENEHAESRLALAIDVEFDGRPPQFPANVRPL